MRLKYYKRSLRKVQFSKPFILLIIFIIVIISILSYMYTKAFPIITSLCETSARAIALEVTNKAVSESIYNIKYDDLVSLKQDATGKIIAINADVMELNRISTGISTNISNKLRDIESRYVKLPLTSIFNMGLFSGYGPKLPLNIIPMGDVLADFKSEFEQAGINQIRHRISIQIVTRVRLIAPFYTSSQEYINEVTVAETVIVGDTPNTYYNINGMQSRDTFELIK